jgi:ATP-binding cassette subfamily B protein
MNWLKRYMPIYLRLAVPAWICLFGEVMVDLSLPTLMASIINQGVLVQNLDHVRRVGLQMLGLALLGMAFGLSRNWLSTHASQDLGTSIRADLFRKTQRMSLKAIRSVGASSLITRLTNDVMQVQNLSFMLMRIFIRAPLLLIGGIVMAFLLNRQLAMILVFILPMLGFLIYLRIKRGYPLFRKVQAAIDRINAVLREYLNGIREVKVFNRMIFEGERYEQASRDLSGFSIKAARSMATIQPLIFMLMNGSIILLLWLGATRVSSGQTQVGDIVAFINYFLQILIAMTMLSMIVTAGARSKTSIERIGQVFAIPVDEADITAPGSALEDDWQPTEGPAALSIAMDGVSFTFPGQTRPILKDIRFRIEAGQTAAIIGSTGCGKSTLISLLLRFYEPDSGLIQIGDQNISQLPTPGLRDRIALVPQQSVLFTGTLEDNLRWGNQTASAENLRQAIEIARADEFIDRMPEGLKTRTGQGGVNLSGGQKQRLCMARALIRMAPVLILDDSTSAIDMVTEQQIWQTMKDRKRGMTVIVIAQRIHTVMHADTILVMDNGQISAQGSHSELLQTSTIYRDIYRSQIGLGLDGKEVI